METVEILTITNICLTFVTLIITYFSYRFSKKKDLEDKLFDEKTEIYKEINQLCYSAYHQISPKVIDLKHIENCNNKNQSDNNFENEILKLKQKGIEIEDKLFTNILFIPSNVVKEVQEYSRKIVSYVESYPSTDTKLKKENHIELWDNYQTILITMRHDLKINNIDKSLLNRIERKVM